MDNPENSTVESPEKKEFSNDFLTVTVVQEPACRTIFEINVTPKKTQDTYTKALKMVSKEVSIPGFRKGKAPKEMIISNFGKTVDQEWHSELIKDSFFEAAKLTNIFPLRQEAIEKPQVKSISKEEGSSFSMTFERYPDIPENLDISSIQVTKPKNKDVTEEDVEKAVEELLASAANWNDIKDRPIQENDYVFVDVDQEIIDNQGEEKSEEEKKEIIVHDGIEYKSLYRKFPFEVVKGKIGDWMYKALVGSELDQTVEATSEVDETANDDVKKAFVPTKHRITISKIYEREKPEINEKFLKNYNYESEEDMRAKLRLSLEREAQYNSEQEFNQRIKDALTEAFTFDIPHSELESERENRLRSRIQELHKQKYSKESILQMEKQIEEEVLKESINSLSLYYLYGTLIRQAQIKVSKDEVNQKVEEYLNTFGKLQKLAPGDLAYHFENSLTIEKIMDYLKNNIVIVEE